MKDVSFRLSLAPMPEFRASGSFTADDRRVSWIQPSDHWQVHWAIRGPGVFSFNGRSVSFDPYTVFVVPPGSRCSVVGSGSEYVYCFLSFVPQDVQRDLVSLPFMTPMPSAVAASWELDIRRSFNRLPWTRSSIHAFTYHLLWYIARPEHEYVKSVYTEEAERIISSRLAQRLSVAELCEELQISHSQLNRLFKRDHSLTPMQYIRGQRAVLAHELLTSTAKPIKAVAALCGMPDADQFCKLVRDRFGCTPRRLRNKREPLNSYKESDPEIARLMSRVP